MLSHFPPSVNFLLIKISPPEANTTSLCCCHQHLWKRKSSCKWFRLKASQESTPAATTTSYCNTTVTEYNIIYSHLWSHWGLTVFKAEDSRKKVAITESSNYHVIDSSQGTKPGTSEEHHYRVTPVSVTGKSEQGKEKKLTHIISPSYHSTPWT